MGEICRKGGLICFTPSNDHDPAHVHVTAASWQVRVALAEEPDEVAFMDVKHGTPSGKEIKKAIKLVADNLDACWAEWERIHGDG